MLKTYGDCVPSSENFCNVLNNVLEKKTIKRSSVDKAEMQAVTFMAKSRRRGLNF